MIFPDLVVICSFETGNVTRKPVQAAAKCYAERYPDLRASFCKTPKDNSQSGGLSCSWRKLLQHYVSQGVQEERQWGCSGNMTLAEFARLISLHPS